VQANSTGADIPAADSDRLTVIAIAVVATICGDLIHEGLGHGGACLLTGGRPLAISTVHFACDRDSALVSAGGTIANLLAGVMFFGLSRLATRSTARRFLLWLSMTLNLFAVGGYFLFSGVGNIGDWADVMRDVHPMWLWRIGLAVLGAVLYGFSMWVSLLELRPFLGRVVSQRVRRARQITLTPYLTNGILSCVAGLFNPVGMILVAISAAASSFGGASGLAWMYQWLRGPWLPPTEFEMSRLTRSRGWIVLAAILAVCFVAILGPGLTFHPR
jgi:hypothetical protein